MAREEWRVLPEFPNYEITSDGDVRNRWTFRVLKEIENKRTGAWHYSLRRANGTSTSRGFWSLIYSAWPELKPTATPATSEEEPKRRYARRGGWMTIPDFPAYQMHPDGFVRNNSRRRLEIHMDGDVEFVYMFDSKRIQHARTINQLLHEVFPAAKEKAAA